MPIRLDQEDQAPQPDNRHLVALREAVFTARSSVTYWERQIQQRVREAKALDGWLTSTIALLMGTYDERARRGVDAVREAQTCLEQARRRLQQAEQALAVGERGHDRAVEQHEAHLDQVADQIRGTQHPAATELDHIELVLGQLQAEVEPLTTAVTAGAALAAKLGAIFRNQEGILHDMLNRAQFPLAAVATGTQQHLALRRTLDNIGQQARKFEDACATVGVEIRVGLNGSNAQGWHRTLIHLADSMEPNEMRRFRDDLQYVHMDVEGATQGLLARLGTVRSQIAQLEEQRRDLLKGVSTR